jgi:hypothetical protein
MSAIMREVQAESLAEKQAKLIESHLATKSDFKLLKH